jgi:hypothetical protein
VTIIRRIYAYLLAFAGLAMLAVAAASLIQLIVDLVLESSAATSSGAVRNTVSLSAAAALVGLPVWLAHWLWIGRWVRADAEERTSTLRRLYLYAVLAGATLEIAVSGREALYSAFAALVSTAAPGTTLDTIARPLPFTVIAGLVWLAHWRVAAADRALVGERGGSATLRRWYLYGAAFIGLMLLLNGTQAFLAALWRMVAQPTGSGLLLAGPASDALLGLGLWFAHWVVLPARLPDADRKEDAATSVLRSVYLFGALAVGIIGSLLGLSQLLYYAVARILGVDHPGGVDSDLLLAAAGPTSTAVVFGAAWAYQQRQAVRRQVATFGEAPRQTGVRRLYTYLVALVALSVLASGVAGLLWTLGDLVFPATADATSGAGWRDQVALYATLTMVGLPVWLLHWRQRPTTAAEARSLARRLYVFLSLIVAMLALVGSAAAALYQLLGLVLGAGFTASTAADLAHAVAVASVGAVLAAYQWRVLRTDAVTVQVETTQAETTTPIASAPEAVPASVVVEIQAADAAALCAAMATLRATGVQVTVMTDDAAASGQRKNVVDRGPGGAPASEVQGE